MNNTQLAKSILSVTSYRVFCSENISVDESLKLNVYDDSHIRFDWGFGDVVSEGEASDISIETASRLQHLSTNYDHMRVYNTDPLVIVTHLTDCEFMHAIKSGDEIKSIAEHDAIRVQDFNDSQQLKEIT